MKRRLISLVLLLALALTLLAGCGDVSDEVIDAAADVISAALDTEGDDQQTTRSTPSQEAAEAAAGETSDETEAESEETIDPDGSYTSPEDVALYIHTYGCLPGNFITKDQAKELGWDNSKGNLQEVAPGKSIGGDRFGNYEGLLPEGEYKECDVNYEGGFRGAERLIYSEDGAIYYTSDHYSSFTQLY